MIDLKKYREDRTELEESLKKRNVEADLDRLFDLESQVRKAKQDTEVLKGNRNQLSQRIAKEKLSDEERASIVSKVKSMASDISGNDKAIKDLQTQLNDILFGLPNILDPEVPVGNGEDDNKVVATHGEIPEFNFPVKDHVELGEKLGVFSFETGVKLSGSRFTLLKNFGAKMERALINFMLDTHTTEHGYQEMMPPIMVNQQCLFGTGQLPKFEEDLFKVNTGHYLIPTAEVPLTNMYAQEIIPTSKLPMGFTAYTPCFRSEAGSYGKDTRGYFRQHQFNKVELVWFSHPDNSESVHQNMRSHAEKILELLELPFRTTILCAGDIGFGAKKCYDIEVWMPGQDKYREISSCSNCGDFQARRANIRCKDSNGKETMFVHTLNGSGVAVGRALIAILENYQLESGNVTIPKVLRKYLNGLTELKLEL